MTDATLAVRTHTSKAGKYASVRASGDTSASKWCRLVPFHFSSEYAALHRNKHEKQ